jgi:hypothetical protein
MINQTPPDAMKIDERHDEIGGFINVAITRLQEKAELAGYKRMGEYLVVREKEMERNLYEQLQASINKNYPY